MVNFPVKLTFETDKQSLKKSQKEAQRNAPKSKGGGTKGAALAGGIAGGIVGALSGALAPLLEPLNALVSLIGIALIPILKPFLILFLKVGVKLLKYLQSGNTPGFGFDVSNTVFIVSLVAALVAGASFTPALITALVGKGGFNFGLELGEKMDLATPIWSFYQQTLDNIEWAKNTTKKNWNAVVNFFDSVKMFFNSINLDDLKSSFVQNIERMFVILGNIVKSALNGAINVMNKVLRVLGLDEIETKFDLTPVPRTGEELSKDNYSARNDFVGPPAPLGNMNIPQANSSQLPVTQNVSVNLNNGFIDERAADFISNLIQRKLSQGGRF